MAAFANQSLVNSVCHRVEHGVQEFVAEGDMDYIAEQLMI